MGEVRVLARNARCLTLAAAQVQDTTVTQPTAEAHLTAPSKAQSRESDDITVPIRKSLNVNNVDSIKEYLAKPRLVDSVAWGAQGQGAPLFTDRDSFYSVTLYPKFLGKLRGYTGIRYTTNIRVVLNATPFQQGKLRLAYYPNGGLQKSKWRAHTSTLTSLSQLPGLEMTTADSSMEVSIPFTSFQPYYDMVGDTRDPVLYNVFCFSPLISGAAATNTAPVSVWVWFTDVELFGASTLEPQSRMARRKTIVRGAAEQEEKPLSAWLSATSKLASSMSSVPLISSIAAPTAVWSKYAAGVANAFGYSRPMNGEPVRPMAPHYHASITNADGLNVGSTLALNRDASSRIISDYSPSGMDEMSINFIKKQWAYVREFTFPTTEGSGTQIAEGNLSCLLGASTSPTYGLSVAPIEFLSQLFRMYRGGVELKFSFIKTGFHAGSLSFSYAAGQTTPFISLQDTSVLHKTIVDIQQGDEVCLSFPFISSREWLEKQTPYGRWYCHVVNQLTRPETVAPFVTVQVYARGMDDLEFTSYNIQEPRLVKLPVPLEPEGLQMEGIETEETGEIICEPVGGSLVEPPMTGLQMMDCVSESCTSLLQFLKAGTLCKFPFVGGTSRRVWAFNPAAWGIRGQDGATVIQPPYVAGPLNFIRGCYAFQRGGYELNVAAGDGSIAFTRTPPDVSVMSDYFFGAMAPFQVDPPSHWAGTDRVGVDDHFQVTGPRATNSRQHGLSATLPYRSQYRVNPILPVTADILCGDYEYRARFVVSCENNDTVYLRPAEDFQLLYWVGVPPTLAP